MKFKKLILSFSISVLTINNAFAFPNCQVKYDSDKRSLPSLRGKCNVCHISPNGGGPTNDFGGAFAQAGFKITDELVAKFPNLFQQAQLTPTPVTGGAPIIKRIKPKAVKVNVQSMISIMGQNFIDGAKAFIDSNEVMTTFKSNMLLIVDFILNTVGIHEVKVKNLDGQESNSVKLKSK